MQRTYVLDLNLNGKMQRFGSRVSDALVLMKQTSDPDACRLKICVCSSSSSDELETGIRLTRVSPSVCKSAQDTYEKRNQLFQLSIMRQKQEKGKVQNVYEKQEVKVKTGF